MSRFIIALALMVGACHGDNTFTLYRSDVQDPRLRVHVATFDAAGPGQAYNMGNCRTAADLFTNQPHVTVRYWCEAGRYRASK